LRTEAAAVCELSTADGCQVRLNEKTEVAWPAKDELQLIDGQIWCQTPIETSLRMTTAQETQWTCTSGSESLASVSGTGSVRVLAVSGEVDVTAQGTRHPLRSGMTCVSANEEVSVRPSSEDFLLASRWMQPLLTREGHDNAELGRRVNAMLSQIGRTKNSFLLEQDLRNLGEYGALPLLRFVQTADAETERDRRQTAIRILTDTAPIWMVPDLIALLEDADPHIRGSAATALARLTRETQGLTADDWRGDRSRWAAGVSSWREWWTHHSVSCAPPPAGVSRQQDAAQPGLIKARNDGATPQ
jgi:hypothetical protein